MIYPHFNLLLIYFSRMQLSGLICTLISLVLIYLIKMQIQHDFKLDSDIYGYHYY